MSINSEDNKKLRIKTGAGMMDCKKALDETNEIEKAIDWVEDESTKPKPDQFIDVTFRDPKFNDAIRKRWEKRKNV